MTPIANCTATIGVADARRAGSQFAVNHHWSGDLPLFARAMVLADGKLFVAGPPDVVDEEQALKQIDDPMVRLRLADQAKALEGKKGARLWVVSASDGKRLAEHRPGAPLVFDGMAAAGGRQSVHLPRPQCGRAALSGLGADADGPAGVE